MAEKFRVRFQVFCAFFDENKYLFKEVGIMPKLNPSIAQVTGKLLGKRQQKYANMGLIIVLIMHNCVNGLIYLQEYFGEGKETYLIWSEAYKALFWIMEHSFTTFFEKDLGREVTIKMDEVHADFGQLTCVFVLDNSYLIMRHSR